MGSKKYKGKPCVYCATPGAAETEDHVVARQFFRRPWPIGLPVVPACFRCNNEKSRLEHYATAVLPFGATHAEAATILSTLVPGRLANNQKLHRHLADNADTKYVSRDGGGSWESEMTLPLDGARIEKLFEMMARGLAFWEWDVLLPDADCIAFAGFLVPEGRAMFDRYFAGQGVKTGIRNFGDGAFVYEGVQSLESPQLTLLRMSFYGAEMGGDLRAPGEKVRMAYALTAPRRMSASTRLVELLRGADARQPRRADRRTNGKTAGMGPATYLQVDRKRGGRSDS